MNEKRDTVMRETETKGEEETVGERGQNGE